MFNPFNIIKKDNTMDTNLTNDEMKDIENLMAGIDTPELPTGVLAPGESHPATRSALVYVKRFMSNIDDVTHLDSVLKQLSTRNRLAEICSETFTQLMNNETVEDNYLLGLAWTIRNIDDARNIALAAGQAKPDEQPAVTIDVVDNTTHPDGK